jgi:hypothetical protein
MEVVRWAGHVALTRQTRIACRILVGETILDRKEEMGVYGENGP